MPRAGETLHEWELVFKTVSKPSPQHQTTICKTSPKEPTPIIGGADKWWIKKINNTKDYPLGTDKIFKCLHCPKTYFSKEALDRHHAKASGTKRRTCVPVRGGWKEEYAVDTMENRLNWWKRS